MRRVVRGDDAVRRQILLAHSDMDRSYPYGICHPPYLPIESCVSTIHVIPVVESGKAFVEWSATFDCACDKRNRQIGFFERDGFAEWLDALGRFMAVGKAERPCPISSRL